MKVIYRYTITNPGVASFPMPEGAEIISAVPGNTGLHLYAKCDPDAGVEPRHFVWIKTGVPFPDEVAKHIVSLPGGVHIFEVDSVTADAFTLATANA